MEKKMEHLDNLGRAEQKKAKVGRPQSSHPVLLVSVLNPPSFRAHVVTASPSTSNRALSYAGVWK